MINLTDVDVPGGLDAANSIVVFIFVGDVNSEICRIQVTFSP